MLEIMEGVIRLVKNSKEKTGHQAEREESVDADVENSSADEVTPPEADDVLALKETSSKEKTDSVPLTVPGVRTHPFPGSQKVRVCSSSDSTEDDSELEDKSYSPDKQKVYSPKKKSPSKSSNSPVKSPPKLRGPRKKLEISVDDIDAEFPKICRKRKIPSYFNEYALPYSEEEVDVSIIKQPFYKKLIKKLINFSML